MSSVKTGAKRKVSQPEFSGLRAALFPIQNIEFKKFLPLAFIMLCVLFNYTILRDTKDSLIATAPGAGPEAIPYLKAIFVMLGAMSFVVLYTKLTNMFSSEKLFYGIVSFFLGFFALFSFVLYPNIDVLHPNIDYVNALQLEFPRVKFLLSVWAVWTYSLFYVMSEMWGSVMISLLFWQFANEIVRSSEAKRFYPLFVLIGNVALMLSGTAVVMFSDIRQSVPAGVDAWGVALQYLGITVIIAGLFAMYIYRWMHKNVLTDPVYYDAASPKTTKKSKSKMGVADSFKYLFSSPYIGLIALLVLSYGMSINLIEVIWKKQLSIQFAGDPNGYNAFMGNFSRATGAATILIIFMTKGVVNKFGWFTGAVITPLILALTGGMFFSLVLFSEQLNPIVMGLGFTATYMAVLVGAVQNILTKGTKYALFDPTKEMAYIPLDQDLKTKGKAAVDVIGGRLGKAAGGYTVMAIFTIFAVQDIMVVTPYLAVIIAAIVVFWVFGVGALSVRYNRANGEKEIQEAKKIPEGKTV